MSRFTFQNVQVQSANVQLYPYQCPTLPIPLLRGIYQAISQLKKIMSNFRRQMSNFSWRSGPTNKRRYLSVSLSIYGIKPNPDPKTRVNRRESHLLMVVMISQGNQREREEVKDIRVTRQMQIIGVSLILRGTLHRCQPQLVYSSMDCWSKGYLRQQPSIDHWYD